MAKQQTEDNTSISDSEEDTVRDILEVQILDALDEDEQSLQSQMCMKLHDHLQASSLIAQSVFGVADPKIVLEVYDRLEEDDDDDDFTPPSMPRQ